MDYQDSGFNYDEHRYNDGRMSASNQRGYSQAQRPTREELARYSTLNYTSRRRGRSRFSKIFGKPKKSGSSKRKYVLIGVAAVVVLLLVVPGVLLGVSAKSAMDDARLMMSQGSTLASQIQSGDAEGARRTAENFDSVAKKLEANVTSPLWAPLVFAPVYGEDVRSVRNLSRVASRLSTDVLVPLTRNLPTGGSARIFVDGAINIPVVQVMLNSIANGATTIQECAYYVGEMPEPHISQLQQPMALLKEGMVTLDGLSTCAGSLAGVLPGLLGANGPRTYMLVAFGESELRSTGGFPGSTGVMHVENGRLDVSEMNAPALPPTVLEDGVIQFPTEERILFGDRVNAYFYDAGYIPHFPRAAQFMKAIWDSNDREPIDGIICLDPVFLQRVLGLTGEITTADGTVVDGTNAAEMLLKDVYIKYSQESFEAEAAEADISASSLSESAQNGFFSEVATLALAGFFENISSVDLIEAAQVIGESVEDKRFYMWVDNPEEQAILEAMGATCSMSYSVTHPELGVYLATTVATKGNWYIQSSTEIDGGIQNNDGTTTYHVKTTIANTMTPDEAETLPLIMTYIDRPTGVLRSKGDAILDVYLVTPMGGMIRDIQVNGYFLPENAFEESGAWFTNPGAEPFTKEMYNDREFWFGVTGIGPQQSTEISYTVTTSPEAIAPLSFDTTPLAQE